MPIGTILTGIGAIGSAVGNYFSQRNTNRQQKELANTSFQRMSRDLTAAGYSPIMGVGSGGSATPSLRAPESKVDWGAISDMIKATATKSVADANVKNLDANTTAVTDANNRANETHPLAIAEQKIKNYVAEHTKTSQIAVFRAQVRNLNLDAEAKRLDNQLKRWELDLRPIQKEITEVSRNVAVKFGLKQAEAEYWLKEVLAEGAQYNREWYGASDLPFAQSGTTSAFTQQLILAKRTLQQVRQNIKERQSKAQQHTDDLRRKWTDLQRGPGSPEPEGINYR